MKLTRQDAQKQAKRLQACPMLAPQTDEGRKEIVDCLMRHCQSAEHAETVMTRFLDEALHVNGAVTAWLAATAGQTRQADQPPPGCRQCWLGPDLSTGEVRWAAHISVQRGEYSFATRCDCERGQWLQRCDAERPIPERRTGAMDSAKQINDGRMKSAGED
jgi:hypothetical protein